MRNGWKSSALRPHWLERRPDELSGGELARIALLRALDPRTRFLIADEGDRAAGCTYSGAQIWQVLIEESEKRPLGLVVFQSQ